ncbi:MAG: TnsA endonuclease N-terminal domain-containing protein [Chloroflexi bacterium]|nr:TnsA endonuclease N-terminal domain-containing protein [Chloroflexota bacterium]
MPFRRKPPPGNVRRVVALGNNVRGVTTNKCGHLVQFESEQEHKLILLLERDPSVVDYLSQPETLHFEDANQHPRRYTPDFKVWRTDGQIELHEVTLASRRASRESLQLREEAARAVCQARGWRYLVHTEETLPAAQEYANLNCLSAFRALTYASPELAAWWQAQLAGEGPLPPGTVLNRAAPPLEPGPLLNTLYHLLWHGVIHMDWRQPFFWRDDFHPTARIWLPSTAMRKESST